MCVKWAQIGVWFASKASSWGGERIKGEEGKRQKIVQRRRRRRRWEQKIRSRSKRGSSKKTEEASWKNKERTPLHIVPPLGYRLRIASEEKISLLLVSFAYDITGVKFHCIELGSPKQTEILSEMLFI